MAEADSVLAGRLSYSQCWEDTAVLRRALAVGPGDDVLSIASAGDNSFALAMDGARVTALDLSLPQLALTELKLCATELDYEAYLRLLGLEPDPDRSLLYLRIRDGLSERARSYWDNSLELLRRGVLGQGRFEKYLAMFRKGVLPLVHRRGTVEALFELPSLQAQAAFYEERWNTLRWRQLFRLFFSRVVMASRGRSRAHFAHVTGAVAPLFLKRTRHVLTELPIQGNPYLEWILRGHYADVEQSHPYLTPEGHRRLREVRPRIELVHAPLDQFLARQSKGRFSAFNYSNMFEYVSPEQHEAMLDLTLRVSRPGARVAYWNLLVPRSRPESMAPRLKRREEEAKALLFSDRSFVYGGFNLEVVRGEGLGLTTRPPAPTQAGDQRAQAQQSWQSRPPLEAHRTASAGG
jgi:S-adenosylmethionine-diacylglycerol 3-amino-3-carboxypropyl transferase